jgi:hypothetical protein
MPRRDIQVQAGMATARIIGRRWSVAMRDVEWNELASESCTSARGRLIVTMEHFCDSGDRDLPGSCFRWLSRTTREPQGARQGSFQAHGVVLRGHASDRVFFITSIEIDPTPLPHPTRRNCSKAVDQRQIPLAFGAINGENDG